VGPRHSKLGEIMNLKLGDESIAHIAKLLQMAILSGTDITDHLRMMRLTTSEKSSDVLVMTPEYREISDDQVKTMLQRAEDVQSELSEISSESSEELHGAFKISDL